MQLLHTITEVRQAVRAARAAGRTIGLVPTMGALHAGHLSLLAAARARGDFLVVSIFVNPTQFGPAEDLAAYPRTPEADAEACRQAQADVVFAPAAEEMYPEGFATTVRVAEVTEGLCGRFRPGHFEGVATVVCKLLNIVQPDRAYFGEKDYQQIVVLRRMAWDLDLPVEILGCPTVREADGLALSSRNRYLSPGRRQVAPELYRALLAGAEVARRGGTGKQAVAAAQEILCAVPEFRVQYLEAVDPETLAPRPQDGPPLLLAAAVYLGDTRLLDNIRID
jgi:pantoate--beta-alanine ligase